jgi:hypothetical protein
MVHDREKMGSVLDIAPQKSTNFAKIFKKLFNHLKNAGPCYQQQMMAVHSVSNICTSLHPQLPVTVINALVLAAPLQRKITRRGEKTKFKSCKWH